MRKLKSLIELHKNMEFPPFPSDDDFSEWVEELVDVDMFYVGIFETIANEGKQKLNPLPLRELRYKFQKFLSIEEDKEIYELCKKYLDSLEAMLVEAEIILNTTK